MAPTRRSKSQSISSVPGEVLDNQRNAAAKLPRSNRNSQSPSTASAPVSSSGTSKLPDAVRFPLAVFISFGLSTFLFSIPDFIVGDLAAVSKSDTSWPGVVGLLLWKSTELAICWVGGFDAFDAASLITLTHAPYHVLLWLFYLIRPTSAILSLTITVVSFSVPFALLRPLALIHYPSHAPRSSVHNRSILTDPQTWIYTSLLATAVYTLVLEGSFVTYLPSWLTTNFTDLPILRAEVAPERYTFIGVASMPALMIALLPVGLATREFLFVPSISTPPAEIAPAKFDTATAGFVEHVYQNVWGWWTTREQALIVRVTVAATLTLANTTLEVWANVRGATPVGSFGFALPWVASVAVSGILLAFVGKSS